MKTYWGSGGIAPHILNLGTRWTTWYLQTITTSICIHTLSACM